MEIVVMANPKYCLVGDSSNGYESTIAIGQSNKPSGRVLG